MITKADWVSGIGGLIIAQGFWFFYHRYTMRKNPYTPPANDDAEQVANLRRRMLKAGIAADGLVRICHYAFFTTLDDAKWAAEAISNFGYDIEVGASTEAGDGPFIMLIKKTILPDQAPEESRQVMALVEKLRGEYDLWKPVLS